jgi:hypothetical protein
MSAKDKPEPGKTKTETPPIRELRKDEIDSVSGGKTTSWVEPDTQPVQSPKSPGWVEPDTNPAR